MALSDSLREVARRILSIERPHPIRVAIDGVDCAGKTLIGTAAEVKKRYEQRYVPGQKLYLAQYRPQENASFVIDNNDNRASPFLLPSAFL